MIAVELEQAVLDTYRQADANVAAAAPVCVASGRCCRFKEWGHVLYLSNLEAQVLLDHCPDYEAPVPEDFCPFQKDRLCTARESRPLSCRVYFCDPAYQETAQAITEKYVRQLKQIAEANDLAWEYAPLHHFLNRDGSQSQCAASETMKERWNMRPAFAFLLFWTLQPVWADDWPQWLGPRRDGSSAEKVTAWKEAPKVLWKKAVGEGHSSPVVVDGRAFLFTKVNDKNEEKLTAYDAVKGDVMWEKVYDRGAFNSLFGNGPRGSPAVVDGKVYTLGITGILTCRDAKTGDSLWQVDTLKEFKAANLFFGMSGSPLVEGDKVFVNVGGKGAGLVAFDKNKGDVAWKQLDDRASYSSPIAFGEGEIRQIIFLTGKGLVGVYARDGSIFWQHPFEDKLAESSTTPIIVGDLLVGSSVTLGMVALQLDNSQAIPRVKKIWQKPELTCYFSTPVAVGKDYLYVVTGIASLISSTATLHCVEAATGKVLWKRPKVGKYHASLLRTGDNKLLLVEEAGNLVLLDPSPKEYRELCRAKICGNTWAHPALANGRLYIRDEKELVCVELPTR